MQLEERRPPEGVVFGRSAAMAAIRRVVEAVVSTNVPILILGESGSGKEVLAKEVHYRSERANHPFLKVSCPAIPASLLESELFGYEKGAFTGAHASKPGRVELAHQGTLFLDEIAELDISLQAKLLHLLQDGRFSRVGDREERQVDVHFIAATNQELETQVALGHFRQDLFFRLNVITIQMPPLRERREDIPLLVEYFLAEHTARYGRAVPPPSPTVLQLLEQHSWPGSIRELENVIKRYVILGTEDALVSSLMPRPETAWVKETPQTGILPLKQTTKRALREVERAAILNALQATRWNRRKAAKLLQISYRALLYKIKDCGLPSKRTPSVPRDSEPDVVGSDPPSLAAPAVGSTSGVSL